MEHLEEGIKLTGVLVLVCITSKCRFFVQVVDHVIWLEDGVFFSVSHVSAIVNSLARLYRNLSLWLSSMPTSTAPKRVVRFSDSQSMVADVVKEDSGDA
jgi:hypothetical protein